MLDRINSLVGKRPVLVSLGLALAVCLAINQGTIRRTASDPLLTLLTSTAMVRRQTIQLDPYRGILPDHYAWLQHGGHAYNTYPLGPSVVALPLVFTADRLGIDCVAQSFALQMVLAALCAMATVVLLYAIALRFLPPFPSLVAAGLFFFGTGLLSSNGNAYWTHTVSTVFVLLAIWSLVRYRSNRNGLRDAGLGLTLFFAYFCRPTAALFVVFALIALFFYHPKSALRTAVWTGLGLACYFGFNHHEFGSFLTPYAAQPFAGSHPLVALYGLLCSPNRGLLVYSPFLAIFLIFSPVLWRRRRDPLLLVALVWPFSLIAILSFWSNWWGGHSFGPRLLVDVLPGFFLLGCLIAASLARPKTFFALCLVLGLPSLWIHYQGLHDQKAWDWNERVDIDRHPEKNFDWRDMQLFAGSSIDGTGDRSPGAP
jgi:hypothetical protein